MWWHRRLRYCRRQWNRGYWLRLPVFWRILLAFVHRLIPLIGRRVFVVAHNFHVTATAVRAIGKQIYTASTAHGPDDGLLLL
jgi:hypothetical protein